MKKLLKFVHPFLFALYPVVFLYAKNIQEYPEQTIIVPIVMVLIFAAIVLFIVKLIVKKIDKAALISSTIIIIFLSYSRFIETVAEYKPPIEAQWVVAFGSIIAIALVSFLVYKYPKHLFPINKFLSVLSLFLVLFSLWTIISFEMQTKRIFTPPQEPVKETVKKVVPPKDAPDIYYIIFDRYAGPQSLKEQYHFDNSKFLNFLEKKGFYLADNAKANYPKTFLSIASSLDMNYLDELTKQTNGGQSPDQSLATPKIQNGKAIQFLKEKGYFLVNIGPKTWGPTSSNPYADKNFVLGKGTYPYVDIFTTGFLNTTMASPVLAKIFHNPLDVSVDPNNNEHRKIAVYELNAIKEAVPLEGPKFVFVHILLPHDPFVFDEHCQPISEKDVDPKNYVKHYLDQLVCTNSHIEETITYILQHSDRPPIILLQSDEGPFPMKEPISRKEGWADASDTALREKFPIMNAYYFPDKKSDLLYESITPVNSFRVLFNEYFDTNYELLPDKNYVFQDDKNYYKFTEVTDRIQ